MFMLKFHGLQAGYKATSANNSNFWVTGFYKSNNASYSTLIGYNIGANVLSSIGSNNIIIGTNISLPSATTNSINLGGVLFARTHFQNLLVTQVCAQTQNWC
jgi:hypothetical protein